MSVSKKKGKPTLSRGQLEEKLKRFGEMEKRFKKMEAVFNKLEVSSKMNRTSGQAQLVGGRPVMGSDENTAVWAQQEQERELQARDQQMAQMQAMQEQQASRDQAEYEQAMQREQQARMQEQAAMAQQQAPYVQAASTGQPMPGASMGNLEASGMPDMGQPASQGYQPGQMPQLPGYGQNPHGTYEGQGVTPQQLEELQNQSIEQGLENRAYDDRTFDVPRQAAPPPMIRGGEAPTTVPGIAAKEAYDKMMWDSYLKKAMSSKVADDIQMDEPGMTGTFSMSSGDEAGR